MMTNEIYEAGMNLLPPADMAGEIERLHDDLIVERDRSLRTLADFKNYRRRVERDASKQAAEGKRGIILALLDIIDDLEKALRFAGDSDMALASGVKIIQKKLFALLATHGVQQFESVGTEFDHQRHEAVAIADVEGMPPGTVVDELRRGYLLNNELLRASQVRVSR